MNYYKILEVDRDASPEVIEKAYKTLVKKYHPDLQEANLRKISEEKIKVINQAYEVLSNPNSRAKYDETLKQNEISEEDFNRLSEENKNLYNEINNLKSNNISSNYDDYTYNNNYRQKQEEFQNQYKKQLDYENELQQAKEKAYHDAYIQDLKNRGYKIRYKKTPKDYLKNFIALFITIFILFILFQIPFIKNFFINLYEENIVIKSIVDIFLNIFK